MNTWLNLSRQDQVDLFNQIGVVTNLPPQAIEKDAWVTLILRTVFTSNIAEHFIFKGGTSLSKAFQLIERFSEDIDLGINREFLGFKGELSSGQIRKLRRASHFFVSNDFPELICQQLKDFGVSTSLYEIHSENDRVTDRDPVTISVNYQSVFEEVSYLPKRVLIDVGARSLIDPFLEIEINSIISEYNPSINFEHGKVVVNATDPQKTFLEKLILLHEEFQKPMDKIRHLRMSRHFYDIEQILESHYGKQALLNAELFESIINHRKVFTPIKSTIYDDLKLHRLNIIPPSAVIGQYKKDYREMQASMIHGESLSFDELLNKITKALK